MVKVKGVLELAVSLERVLDIRTAKMPGEMVATYPRMLMLQSKTGTRFVMPVDAVSGVHHCDTSLFQKPGPKIRPTWESFSKYIFKYDNAEVVYLRDDTVFEAFLTRTTEN